MTTILVYGDSNSHGTLPLEELDSLGRLGRGQRWPDVMAERLRASIPDVEVLNESLPGRTTVHDDLVDGGLRNGLDILPAILGSHEPIDLLIIMLGTNDLKHRFGVNAFEIARSIRRLVLEARASESVSDCFLVAPVTVREVGTLAQIYEGAVERQRGLPAHLEEVAKTLNVGFFDAGSCIEVSAIDGVHYGAQAHALLGAAMADAVNTYLNR